MKKYIKPAIEIVELESRQTMADTNPVQSATASGKNGEVITVYNLSMTNATSYNA